VEESLPAFHAMGKAEALNVSIGEYHHGWCNKNREAMYAFFASNLGNSEASSEEWWPSGFGNLSALFDASQLQVTSTGQVRTAPECKPNLIYHSFTRDIASGLVAELRAKRTAERSAQFFEDIRSAAAEVSGFRAPAAVEATGTSGATIKGEGRCTLPIEVSGKGSKPVVAIGSDKRAIPASLIDNLTQAGYTVVQPTLCGFIGKNASHGAFPKSYKGMAAVPDIARNLNRSVVGIHAADIVRVSKYAQQRFGRPVATIVTGELHVRARARRVFRCSLGL